MALVLPNAGEVVLMNYILNKAAPSDVRIHLYTNNITPAEDTVLIDLTEATESGYAPIALPNAGWTVSTASDITTGVHSQVTFSFTENATLYGYYITDSTDTNLLWLESFDTGPFVLGSGGGNVRVTPRATLD